MAPAADAVDRDGAARSWPRDREALLDLARRAVTATARGRPLPEVPRGAWFDAPGAAFVSLHRHGQLRGCIGCLPPHEHPLADTVVRMAVAAARDDPRFPPVGPDELDDLVIEISVLGPLRPVNGPDDLMVGRDGLVVERGGQRGVLLPQVASEHCWDATRFLDETCRKAHLPPGAWREGAVVRAFSADVFAEVR
ncbi:MAG: AmmeMemoRadiSam system protein A [Acidobacteria bacterium]|nr:AmmeMemoRadiSam system protein A [Acidobacteriota bacterium]